MNPVIKSKDFTLRLFKTSDKDDLIRNISDRSIYNTLSIPYPYKVKDWNVWKKLFTEQKRKKVPTDIPFAIEIDGEVVGCIGLHKIEEHKAEIGYWIAKKHWGNGYVTRAVELVTKFAFSKLKVSRVYAPIYKQNKASARVLEKNKFKKEGILRKDIKKDGIYYDTVLYAKTK